MTLELIDFVEQTDGVELSDFPSEAQNRIDGALAGLTGDGGETPPENDPGMIAISSVGELRKLADPDDGTYPLDGKYFLAEDLDLGDGEDGFLPIGSSAFTGSFDGQGNTISNPRTTSGSNLGLFGVLGGASVRNLTVDGAEIEGASNSAGAVAGLNSGGTISDVTVTNSTVAVDESPAYGVGGVVGAAYNGAEIARVDADASSVTVASSNVEASRAGGLVGKVGFGGTGSQIADSSVAVDVAGNAAQGGLVGVVDTGGDTTITGCSADGDVTQNDRTDGANHGGIVGLVTGSGTLVIEASQFTGSLELNVGDAGGRIGGGVVGRAEAETEIARSAMRGSLTAKDSAGGIVGHAEASLTITDSFSNGEFEVNGTGAPNRAGGLVGALLGSVTLVNAFAAGSVSADSEDVFGGVVGLYDPDSVAVGGDSVYYEEELAASGAYGPQDDDNRAPKADISGVASLPTSDMQGDAVTETMAELDFGDTWEPRSGDFPTLRALSDSS